MSANSAINHYTVLGVARDSTSKEIRSAYKKLALKLHPDKAGNSPEATERFRKVAEAENVLSNTILRRQYDGFLDRSPRYPLGVGPFNNLSRGRPGYASTTAMGHENGSSRWNTTDHGDRSQRPCKTTYKESQKNPCDKSPRPTQPLRVQSHEPPRERRPDPWEEFLNRSNQHDPTCDPIHHQWQQNPFSKQKFQSIILEDLKPATPKFDMPNTKPQKAESWTRQGTQRQNANSTDSQQHSTRSNQHLPEIDIEAFIKLKKRTQVVSSLAQAHQQGLKNIDSFKNDFSNKFRDFGNMYTFADNEEVNVHVHLTPMADSHRADCKNHVHIGESSDDESGTEEGAHLPDEHHTPLYSNPSQGEGSADESICPSHNKPTSFADKNCHSSDETVSSSFVNSSGSDERADSPNLTDDDSDGGVPLPAGGPAGKPGNSMDD